MQAYLYYNEESDEITTSLSELPERGLPITFSEFGDEAESDFLSGVCAGFSAINGLLEQETLTGVIAGDLVVANVHFTIFNRLGYFGAVTDGKGEGELGSLGDGVYYYVLPKHVLVRSTEPIVDPELVIQFPAEFKLTNPNPKPASTLPYLAAGAALGGLVTSM